MTAQKESLKTNSSTYVVVRRIRSGVGAQGRKGRGTTEEEEEEEEEETGRKAPTLVNVCPTIPMCCREEEGERECVLLTL